ncbi:basement membrane-specific heparan sulfate proteoglycan core protein isoform X5 [Anopheles funestus]|uniref:basement membrane-specific heparan sulfate proteoglycan core protein isoform X5 n=1 Tax=Anopheles funestus TaxID=62324 RepID=UPI0020C69FFE|nr:basement membrane-specific heparan sulfate proteoglycan core protein isoform X5 [Anopheles funestus]
MAAVRCRVAALLLLLLAAIGTDAARQQPSIVDSETARDSDLVFEDEKPSGSSNFDRLMDIENQENLRLFATHSKPTFEHSEEPVDIAEPLGSSELSYTADDVEEFNEDDEEADNEVALPDEPEQDEQNQSWLMRNVKRIKRSLDSLWGSATPSEPNGEAEHNGTKQGKHKKKASTLEKPRKPKNKKKQLTKEERQKRREQKEHAAAAGTVSQTTTTQRSSSGTAHQQSVAHNAISPIDGKSTKFMAARPKRQYDTTFDDTEGSGFEGSGENGAGEETWTFYKMTITLDEPFQKSMNYPNSEKMLHTSKLVKDLIDEALRTDFLVIAKRFEPYPLNKALTLVTLELNAPKDFNLDEMEDRIRSQLQRGNYELRPDGLSLVLADDADSDLDGKDENILDPFRDSTFPGRMDDGDEEEDDEEDEEDDFATDRPIDEAGPNEDEVEPTTEAHYFGSDIEHTEITDLCRGDDKVRCGKTSVYICAVQWCDNITDCPNGEDENESECQKCGKDEFSCDRTRCVPLQKKCDGHRDCNDGEDEANCNRGCKPNQIACLDGACIEQTQRCDHVPDCSRGEDELDCDDVAQCDESSEFLCREDNTCILTDSLCDGRADCSDGEDEQNCEGCSPYEFQCRWDKQCIPLEKKCDRVYDCYDKTDEQVCDCTVHEFRCDNGYCIPKYQRCDRVNHCNDRSDERGCNDTIENQCNDEEFLCNNGRCIPKDYTCNDMDDCGDNSDEYSALCGDSTCMPDELTCYDGGCVSNAVKCDGHNDCSDGTDEMGCDASNNPPIKSLGRCAHGQFECNDGICIADYKHCNGIVDCHDESDETGCNPDACSPDEFSCDGQCYEMQAFCNGIPDCMDGSDEQNCIICYGDAFHCKSKQCILAEHYCDGEPHCSDGSDELDCKTPSDPCREDEIYCDNRCLEDNRRCDGHEDCSDGTDEHGCPSLPEERCEELQCPDGNCFRHSQRCDGVRNCDDAYDEQNCPCRSNEFTCGDGFCIPNHQVCNRRTDCADGSDERNCSCARDEFRCGTGQCIDNNRRCDQRIDCVDGSDERDCRPVACRSNEWKCHDGQCIRHDQRCDRRYDCADRSDELSCYSCGPNKFRCENGPCIAMALKCNGRVDCPYDTSDELDCTAESQYVPPPPFDPPRLNLRTYPDEQTIKEKEIVEGNEVVFQCRDEGPMHAKVRWVRGNGQPLPPGTRDMNGRLEIPNIRIDHNGEYVCEAVGYSKSTPGSTKTVHLTVERYNYQRPPTACAVNEATCMNGDCILKTQICDGNRDCNDGSDETGCSPYQQCEPNQFKCRNSKCVLKTWLCDGEQDCGDGSDEENCATLSPEAPCRYDEFQCRTGQCIPKSFQCDTHPDCQDKSDEVGCMSPSVIQPPPPSLTIPAGGILNITCRATGVPVPLIVWRLNWGHVPQKCKSRSDQGLGRLTCEDMQPIDSGAYSCEIINTMGTHFVSPDTIVIVTGSGPVCQQGTFNNKARNPADCINCFCFGVSTTCSSADLYTYALKPPVSSLTIVGVEGPWTGRRELMIGEFENHNLTAQRHGVQLRLTNLVPGRRVPYYSLPEEYKGNQLKSYGGSIRYDVEYDGTGRPVNAPDVILKGNGMTLVHWHSGTFYPDIKNHVSVSLLPSNWQRADRTPASREDIMMVLASIESILIRMQYVDGIERNIELVNVMMDSAAHDDRGLGSASLVEECRCPPGYRGLSCESCEHGYVRQSSGPWLGRCVPRAEECRPGYFGDPNRGIPCSPCPCPVAGDKSRARSCYLDNRDNVVCKCDRGYAGERCMECDVGYVGNPLGEGCFPRPPTNCNSLGTERVGSDGRCYCKSGIEGAYCDRCDNQHFYLHEKGCIDCFCMGVVDQCTSTTWTRDTIQASFADGRSGFSLISDYNKPSVIALALPISNREIVYRSFGASDDTFYWRLPTQFLGNKLTSFGGSLNYTLRYTPHSSGGVSRNNSPDVVLHSSNKIKLHHYRNNNGISPYGSSTHSVAIEEDEWQNYEDGNTVTREYLLMALANVSDIFIKATYNTVSNEAALSHVSLDIARDTPYGSGVRAWPVEQCQCPVGFIGLSCEDCAPGYFKGEQGIYLGLCEPCACNGHSSECDSQTGVCMNCRDNTYGNNCELCRPPYTGNATVGTPYDCTLSRPDQTFDCRECDVRGSTGSCQRGCECKRLVEGRRCDECREGSFNLNARSDTGCLECFCSGVTKDCATATLFREELPVLIDEFDNTITLTDRDGKLMESSNFNFNPSINEISYTFRDRETYYWSLPHIVLGNQVLSYGSNLTLTQHVEGGRPLPDQDIILIGNGMKLSWSRDNYDDGTFTVPLFERKWTVTNRRNSYPASRADLMTVLANLNHILIRATTKESTRVSKLSDIALGTAIPTPTASFADEVEECYCPKGYRGTSCEQCEDLHYRDVYDRSAGLLGACKPCPCNRDNSDSCQMDNRGVVVCNCREGYSGENCDNPPTTHHPAIRRPANSRLPTKVKCANNAFLHTVKNSLYDLYHKCDNDGVEIGMLYKSKRSNEEIDTRPTMPPRNPVIEVVINVPSIKIVEIGDDFRADCKAHHIMTKNPIDVQWTRMNGRMPDSAYTDRGTLVITNIQITDGGLYVCKAGSGAEVVYKQVTINVSKQEPVKPTLEISAPGRYIDQDEYQPAEVRCTATGYPTPSIRWERVDQPLPYNIVIDGSLLRFNSLRLNDAGTYRCVASNNVGEDDGLLTVYVRPAVGPTMAPPSSHEVERIEITPSSFDGQPGEKIRLVCRCSPTAQIVWTKLGEPQLPYNVNVNNEILIIEHASQENTGRYSCTAYFPNGRVKTSTVDVMITDNNLPPEPNRVAPRVNPLNKNYVVMQGSDFSLSCEATGTPYPTIKWTLSGKTFESNVQQSGSVLRILNAQPSNGGVYICVANNEEGMDRAYTVIEIDRRERPVLEVYPSEPQSIKVGESVRLSCRASAGVPYPTITWVRKDRMPLSTRFTNDAEGVITLREAALEDAGEYECRAENVAGTATIATTIEVLQPPIITLKPNEYYKITENDDFTINCSATGKPAPMVTLTPPRGTVRSHFGQQTEGLREVTLKLHRAELNDAGTYECTAKNAAGEDSQYLTLQVDIKRGDVGGYDDDYDTPSRVPTQPPRQNNRDPQYPIYHTYKAVLGEESHLLCHEELRSAMTEWRRSDGRPLPYGSIVRGGNLTIENTGYDANGMYDCVTYTGMSSQPVTVVRIMVDVVAPPKITFSPTMPMTVRPGDKVDIYCNITGDQPIESRWHGEQGYPLPPTVQVYGNYLRFSSIALEDAGRYYCSASNKHGNTTKVAEVIVNKNELMPEPATYGQRYYNVVQGSSIRLECKLPSDAPYVNVRYNWNRREQRLPPNARIAPYGKQMQLSNVARDDAGTYECSMTYPNGTVVYDSVVLTITDGMTSRPTNVPSLRIEPCIEVPPYYAKVIHIIYLSCVRDSTPRVHRGRKRNVSRLGLSGGTRSSTVKDAALADKDVSVDRPKRPPTYLFAPESLPILQLEPARSMVRPGESVVVDCSSSAGTDVPIRWEKSDGTPLPYNIRQEGNRLYIQNAREDDTGSYTCICYTDDGLRYITDFQLEVEENTIPDVLPRSTSRLEFAERGTTVKLQCNTDQYPTSYQWTRENGELPSDRDTRGSTLILPNVQASDAGKYVCSAKHGGQLVNVVTTLVVNNVIPFFPQSPLSYMEFKSFDNVYSKFYFEISFKPEKMNGLILYASQRRPNQDYIALSLRNGYPQFRFNFDGQQVVLQPEKPVHMGKWHTVKVNRVRNNGFLLVDDQTPVNFPEKLKFYGLNLDDHLFVGGVPQFDQVPASAMEFKEGFVGCISRLKLNDREVQLYQDALETVGITTCEPCAEDPCNNAGTCMEAQTAQGFSCLCRDGFTGRNCQHEGDGCSMDTCGVGRCEETDSGTECYCPIHKTGDRCQYTEHYTDATLAFKDGSYAAYDKFQSKRSIRFRFKPDSLENGIMFYAAEHEQSYGDFMAAILNNGFVELRYSVAGKMKPLIVRSTVPIEVGQWHTVSAGRSKAGIGYLQVDDEPVHNEVSNRNTPILLQTKVYAGGYDKRLLLSQEIGVRRGFEGCIAELETSGNKLNMIDDIRDSANVYHCGHAGAPQPYPSGDQNPVTCRPGRGGDDCETITDICLEQRPCENGALCQTHQGGQNYTCTCQPGYLGLRCEVQYNTLVASRFAGNGFIEINPKAFKNNENQVTTEIAIMFSTQEQNGLLIWYGQRNDEEFLGHDYIALAIQSGFAELTIRMDGQESYVRNSDVYVSDQERHVALIRRERNQFHLQVDSLTVHGETRPTGKQTMDIPGSIYVGGVPDIERVTGNRFNESFNGCVFSVENIEENQSIELRDYAIRTVNVDVCDEPDLGPEPPVV